MMCAFAAFNPKASPIEPSWRPKTGFKALLLTCSAFLVGCVGGSYDEATPVTKLRSELQAEIHLDSARSNNGYDRLFAIGTTLYASVKGKGVQVIDNSDAIAPKGIAFINLPGVEDVVIEGDTFITNQYSDLVIFSISQQKEISRIEDLYSYKDYLELPNGARWVYNASILKNHVVVGFEIEEVENDRCFILCW